MSSGYRRYFTDVVTVYHRTADPETKEDGFTRVILRGVMARWRTDRAVDASGVVKLSRALSVTVLPDADPGDGMRTGDYLLVGEGPVLTGGYALKDLRRDWPSLAQIRQIADNRARPHLKHRRADCI